MTRKEPTIECLVATLAQRVMGWSVGPDRFVLPNRSWMPKWRFQPTKNLDDAFRLLDESKPDAYSMASSRTGSFSVRVSIKSKTGDACEQSKPLAITLAIARALGLEGM